MNDERFPALLHRRREQLRDGDLALPHLVRQRAVAAEVRGEEDGVDVLCLEKRARRAREAEDVLLARAGEVDRVRRRGRRRQQLAQPGLRGLRQHRQLDPAPSEEVARDRAVAAAVADDCDPAPPGTVRR